MTEFEPYIGDPDLTPAYIFDVDGTTMHNGHGRGFFDWDRVGLDTPKQAVIDVAIRLKQTGADIIVVSGRDVICEPATVFSLTAAGMPIDAIFMRPHKDNRDDTEVKGEILFRDIAPRWNVLGSFDDRNKVVAFWRSVGITCFQVADGDF